MLRPSGSIVLPFEIKKASLALRIESLFEKTFSMGISFMSLAVWLGEDRKCCATVVGLDLVLGLSMVRPLHMSPGYRDLATGIKIYPYEHSSLACEQALRSRMGRKERGKKNFK